MIARTLIKKEDTENTFDGLIERIKDANDNGRYAIFVSKFMYISNETKKRLLDEGFKVYTGDWDGVMKDITIIEW